MMVMVAMNQRSHHTKRLSKRGAAVNATFWYVSGGDEVTDMKLLCMLGLCAFEEQQAITTETQRHRAKKESKSLRLCGLDFF